MPEPPDQEIRMLRTWFWSVRDPDGRAFAPLAEAHCRRGDLEEAEALLRDGLARHPQYATGHLVAARVARARGDTPMTLVHLNRALDLDPENVVALLERAECRASEGDRSEARLDLQAVLRIEPGNPDAVGRLEALRADEEGSSPPDDVALPAEGPRIPEVADRPIFTRTMGDIYARQGFYERAVDVFEHLLEESPEDDEIAARLAELKKTIEGADEEAFGETVPAEEEADAATDRVHADQAAERSGAGTIEQYFEDLLAWVPGAVPIESLAPGGAVPIESLAPDTEVEPPDTSSPEPADEGLDEFQRWLESLRP